VFFILEQLRHWSSYLCPQDLILFFCSGTSKTLSVGVLVVIKCIYLPPTYLHFKQDIEDRCLLLMSSVSFVDLPFQEHRMMEKHHRDQNPHISSFCPKPGVVSDNMTWGDDVEKSPGPTDPSWGWPAPLLSRSARVWCQ
jgi:hypothetical protein